MSQKIYQYYSNNPPIEVTDPQFIGTITAPVIDVDNIYDSANSFGANGYFLSRDAFGIRWVGFEPSFTQGIFVQDEGVFIPSVGAAQSFTTFNFTQTNSFGIGTDTLIPSLDPSNPTFVAKIETKDFWGHNSFGDIYRMTNVGIGSTIPISKLDILGTLRATDEVIFSSSLNVGGIVNFTNITDSSAPSVGALIVSGGVGIGKNLFVGGRLNVSSDINLGGQLTGVGTAVLQNRLTVSGPTNLNNTLNVVGVTTLQNNLIVGSAALIGGTLNVVGFTTLQNRLVVGGATTINNTLQVDGATNLNSSLDVDAETILRSNLDVIGSTALQNDLNVSGPTNLNNNLNVTGLSTFAGITTTLTDLSVGRNFQVAGVSTFVGNVTFQGGTINLGDSNTDNVVFTADVNSNIVPNIDNSYDLGSPTQQWKNLYVGLASFTDLYVSGVSTFVGITTNLSTLFANQLSVAGVTTLQNRLNVNGPTNLNNTVNISGITTLQNNLNVIGSTALQNDLNVSGPTNLNNNLNVTGLSTFAGITTTLTDLSVGRNFQVAGVSTFVGNVTFLGGTIGIGDSNTDNVEFNADVNSNIIPNLNNFYDLGSSTQQWKNLYVGLASFTDLYVSGVSTFVGITTNLSTLFANQLSVAGVTTLHNELNVEGSTTLKSVLDVVGITTLQNELNVGGPTLFNDVLNVVGVATFQNELNVDGPTSINNILKVVGVATFQNQLNVDGPTSLNDILNVVGVATFQNELTVSGSTNLNNTLNVVGVTTLQNNLIVGGATTLSGSLNVAGPAVFNNTVELNTSLIDINNSTATGKFDYRLASVGTGVSWRPPGVQTKRAIWVTMDGNDTNSGLLEGDAKRTIGAAATVAQEGDTIFVRSGVYNENNPIGLRTDVSVSGQDLRLVTIIPNNPTKDVFHVRRGCLIENLNFAGSSVSVAHTGAGAVAFPPTQSDVNAGIAHTTISGYVGFGPISEGSSGRWRSPYVRNCTNFMTKSIGMKINGNYATATTEGNDLKSMVCDSFTQYNENGIGVSITNNGYAQLVSIFTINCDIAIYCDTGGACDLTNSNSSFGNYGLVAVGLGATEFTGIVSTYPITRNQPGVDALSDRVTFSDLKDSTGDIRRPYGGQAAYFEIDLNNYSDAVLTGLTTSILTEPLRRVKEVKVINGGSGFSPTSPPNITIIDSSDLSQIPKGPQGIIAEVSPTIDEITGSIVSIDIINSGRNYLPSQTLEVFIDGGDLVGAAATVITEPIYYNVDVATEPTSVTGITTVIFNEFIPYELFGTENVMFKRISRILTSGHSFEYIGTGVDINTSTPFQGSVPIKENEVVALDGAQIPFTSTDQKGNFDIGEGFQINQPTASIRGRDFSKSIQAEVTPLILALR